MHIVHTYIYIYIYICMCLCVHTLYVQLRMHTYAHNSRAPAFHLRPFQASSGQAVCWDWRPSAESPTKIMNS